MLLTLLKSKLHDVRVTQTELEYEGSLGVDPELLELADIKPFERIEIYNKTNGERFATYAIVGEKGSGSICVNGAAARLAEVGDRLIIATYVQLSQDEAENWRPKVAKFDANNKPIGS